MTDDPVEAWAAHLRGERWREDMRPLLEAHRDELPFPEDIPEFHGFGDLHPERPFPSHRFPAPDRWIWDDEEESDEALFEVLRDGCLPLRHFGCGEYDVLVVTGPEAGRVWTLTDVGVARIPEHQRRKPVAGWVNEGDVPPVHRRPSSARQDRQAERILRAVREETGRNVATFLGAGGVRIVDHRDGVARNIDIVPAGRRRTYDVRVHRFPIGRPRELRTTEHPGVTADRLAGLINGDT